MAKMKYGDPYEHLSDEEFEHDFFAALDRDRLKPVSLRLPESVLARSRVVAQARGIPYQVLIKALIESGLNQLERASDR